MATTAPTDTLIYLPVVSIELVAIIESASHQSKEVNGAQYSDVLLLFSSATLCTDIFAA